VRNLYVLGAREKVRFLKDEEEWRLYDRALAVRVDIETKASEVCVEHITPLEARASGDSSVVFKCGTLQGDTLYACTSTEVLIYEVPEFIRTGYISLPCFNDLHHVTPTPEGHLLVANTGLDMVVELTRDGKLCREWNVLGEDPWSRFSKSIDYRKVETTKPHHSHPNFVFQIENEIWVTRFDQKDAVCLTHPGQRIEIGVQKPHDGHVIGDRIYFTTVDGNIVVVEKNTLRTVEAVDLKTIDNPERALLGWCRGLLVLDESRVWVGFTRVRKTKFKENLNWVRHAFKAGEKPTHIALYDLSAQKCLDEVNLEKVGVNVVFSIFPAPESPTEGRPRMGKKGPDAG